MTFACLLLSAVLILTIPHSINNANAGALVGIDYAWRQVKTYSNPTIYFLDHNRKLKKAYINEQAFLSYGNNWGGVKIVSTEQLSYYNNANLFKTGNSKTVYYINKNNKTAINSAKEFEQYGFDWGQIMTVSEYDLSQYQASEFFPAGGQSLNSQSSDLVVGFDNNESGYLAINTKDNLLTTLNFKAKNKTVEIQSLTLNFEGVFNQEIVSAIYLANEAGIRSDVSSSISNRQADFNMNHNPIVVRSGETRKIQVLINFADNKNITNNNLKVSLVKAENVKTNGKVTGYFPLVSNDFKLVYASEILGKPQIKELSLASDSREAVIGSSDVALLRFSVNEISQQEKIDIKQLTVKNFGTSGMDDLGNFKLKNQNNKMIAQVAQASSGNEIVFYFNNHLIKKGGQEIFTLFADIKDGEEKTINFSIKDAKIKGSEHGYGLNAEIANVEEIKTIKRKTVSAIAKNNSINQRINSEQPGVVVATFEIRNNNQKINIESLDFSWAKNGQAPNFTKHVLIVNANNGMVYNSFSPNWQGGKSIGDLPNINLSPRAVLTISLVADISIAAKNGDYYQATLQAINYRGENGISYTAQINLPGTKLVVSKSNLFIYADSKLTDAYYTKGQKNIKLASFVIENSAAGNSLIKGLNISRTENSGIVSYNNGFSNLRVAIDSNKGKISYTEPVSDTFVFDGYNFTLQAGERVDATVYADTITGLNVNQVQLKINELTAVDPATGLPSIISGIDRSSEKVIFGQAKAEISSLVGGTIATGAKNNKAATFIVKNTGDEDLRLLSLTVNTVNDGFSYSLGYSNLAIARSDTLKKIGSSSIRPVAGANKINLGGYIVPAKSEIEMAVLIDANSSATTVDHQIYLSDLSVEGKTSKIAAAVAGDPTGGSDVKITINSGSGESSGTNISDALIKPVSGQITYGYHDVNYPYRNIAEHNGVDFNVSQGTLVKAAASGEVIEAVNGGGTGYSYVVIKHNRLSTVYGHLSRIDVTVGSQVKQGKVIGLSGGQPGTSGAGQNTNGPHLHFEVWSDNRAVDPQKYF